MAEASLTFPFLSHKEVASLPCPKMAENMCYCMRLTKIKCSWTNANPRRRFYACEPNQNARGCGFLVWLDPPVCERSRNVIPGLLRSVDRLQAESENAHQREKQERQAWIALLISWVVFLLICLVIFRFNLVNYLMVTKP